MTVGVDSDTESWFVKDRETWRETFHLALWHELVWLTSKSVSDETLAIANKLSSVTRDMWTQHDREVAEKLELKIRIPLFPDCVLKYPNISSSLSRYPDFSDLWEGPEFPWLINVYPPKARIPAKLRREVLAKYDRKCQVCGKIIEGSFDVHHVKPESEFGPTISSNLVPLHRTCHTTVGLLGGVQNTRDK